MPGITSHDLVRIDNAGRVSLDLHAGQTRAWDATARYVFVVAGTQSGKTSFGPWWLWREVEACGPGDYLAATATYDLFKLKMVPELLRVFVRILNWGTYAPSERVLTNHAGDTRIILRSAVAEGGLESATAKAAWIDECGQSDFRVDAWEAVQRRLSISQGRVLGTTTPYNLGWLKTEIYDRWRAGDPDFAVIQFESIMNPAFPVAEFERAKRTLVRWKFEMFYRGNFSRPAGLIYEDFCDEHIVPDFDPPAEWPRYVGLDFGPVHTSTIWLAHDVERDAFYLYRETLEGGMSTEQHAEKARQRGIGERVVAWAGGAASEDQYRMDWQTFGVRIQQPPIREVEPQIDRVIALLKNRQLFVMESMTGIRDEFGTYSRKLDNYGQPTDAIKDKETFHRLDALRYIIAYLRTAGDTPPMPGRLFVGGRRGSTRERH